LPILGLTRLFDGLNLFGVGTICELGDHVLCNKNDIIK
jgi:hypothetical protein